MRIALLWSLLIAVSVAPVQASTIAVFDNPTYVDTTGGPPVPGSDAVQALLISLGHTVLPFTGFAAADFSAAAGADLILFPHLLSFGVLATDLSAAAKTTLADYVAGGGGIITIGDSGSRLLNAIFYPTCDFVTVFCFATSGGSGPSFLDPAVAAGTPFAAAPAILGSPPEAGNGLNPFAFTPPGGANLYRDQVGGFPNSTTVLTAPFGTGHYGFLAWSFQGAAPLGPDDGGWSDVLDLMVGAVASSAASPTPGASPLSMLSFGIIALGSATALGRGRR
jgi:hypothetical protein